MAQPYTDKTTNPVPLDADLERIFELSPDLVGTGNLEGYFTKVNSAFERLLGFSKKEFYEKSFL